MDLPEVLFASAIAFGRTILGLVTRPYETYRRIAERGQWAELVWLGMLLAAYFALASLVKTAAFRPYLLTKQFVVLGAAVGATYSGVVAGIWVIGRKLGGEGTLRGVAVAWGYTLIPTLAWFLTTSLLYVLLPPPRTSSLAGRTFSVLYLVFSTTLFYWKLTLAYLTLRFGMKFDLRRILMIAGIMIPLLGLYSVGMYKLGIFKVPFL